MHICTVPIVNTEISDQVGQYMYAQAFFEGSCILGLGLFFSVHLWVGLGFGLGLVLDLIRDFSGAQRSTPAILDASYIVLKLEVILLVSLPRVINFSFLFQSLTKDTCSMENLTFNSSILTTSLMHLFLNG